jgi:hypothetical protein
MSYLTFVIGFFVGKAYQAGKLNAAITWSKQRIVGWYAAATKPKEPKQ